MRGTAVVHNDLVESEWTSSPTFYHFCAFWFGHCRVQGGGSVLVKFDSRRFSIGWI